MVRWISLINKKFSDINISQGSVATRLRCGGIFNEYCIAHAAFLLPLKLGITVLPCIRVVL